MKKRKRILSLLLTCCLLTNVGAVAASAESNSPQQADTSFDGTINRSEATPNTYPLNQVEHTFENPYVDPNAVKPEYLPDVMMNPIPIDTSRNASGSWQQDAATGKWWFRYSNGSYPVNTWEQIDNEWYHFDANGWMQTGWIIIGSTYYYLKPSGAMATGWLQLGNTWYFLSIPNGEMLTGWQNINGYYYYFQPGSGEMKTGWLNLGGKWYYMNVSGVMLTGRFSDGSHWYFSYSDGAIIIEQWIAGAVADSKEYYNQDGKLSETQYKCPSGYYDWNCHKLLYNNTIMVDNSIMTGIKFSLADTALDRWRNAGLGINFSFTNNTDNADVIYIYYGFNGEAHPLARTTYKAQNDTDIDKYKYNWHKSYILINNTKDLLSYGTITFQNVIAHEMGHAFGISHSSDRTSLMYNITNMDTITPITNTDREKFRHLY